MKRLALLALAPMLTAAHFKASEFEFAARFMAQIQRNDLVSAKRMLAPGVRITTWDDYRGKQRSMAEFAAYMNKCPIHDFEGVATDEAHNINVNLDCGGDYANASLKFSGGKISNITYGGPPPLVRTTTAQ